MSQPKSTVEQIRQRFDADVARFSNLETGQTATMDAALALELVAKAAAGSTPRATRLLDVGCGAGNFSLRVLGELPGLHVTAVDLSLPMLTRAEERLRAAGSPAVNVVQGDVRDVPLAEGAFDLIVAGAVLHHLRSDDEWRAVFAKLTRALAPGGSIWVFDLVRFESPAVQELMWGRYGDYLTALRGDDYREHVFAYIAQEDTPHTLAYQLGLLRDGGLEVEVLHQNGPFAAFGGYKPL